MSRRSKSETGALLVVFVAMVICVCIVAAACIILGIRAEELA